MVDGDGIVGEGVVLMVFDVKGSLCPISPDPHLVLELCIRLQMKSSAHTIFVMTTCHVLKY